MNPNDASRIIIQLILSALVFFVFSFKFKLQLISLLSEQVYYQLLIIVVILSGYIARWCDLLRGYICHHVMMFCSNKYKLRHYKESINDLAQKTESVELSNEAKEMMTDLTKSDFELEEMIKTMHADLQKIKRP